jgi:probable rRNA maturation factor
MICLLDRINIKNMVEATNLTSSKIDLEILKKIVDTVLTGESREDSDVSVAIVSEARIKTINRKHRKKDRPTDVLSFSFLEEKEKTSAGGLGEIVLCPVYIKKNAKKLKLDYNKELKRALIHGALHLLGYDHERSEKEAELMEKTQEQYLYLLNKY